MANRSGKNVRHQRASGKGDHPSHFPRHWHPTPFRTIATQNRLALQRLQECPHMHPYMQANQLPMTMTKSLEWSVHKDKGFIVDYSFGGCGSWPTGILDLGQWKGNRLGYKGMVEWTGCIMRHRKRRKRKGSQALASFKDVLNILNAPH